MGVQCYWLEPTGRTRYELRRYNGSLPCTVSDTNYHNAHQFLSELPEDIESPTRETLPADAPWPTHCGCGYAFVDTDEWQVFSGSLYQRSDTNEVLSLRDAGPGAMWDASWYPESWRGPDGKCLVVNCPNGAVWIIDGRASNCTMPDDNTHKCWCRSGEPPNITVSKDGCQTCSAGAGSIAAGDYHGFLQNGQFT